MNVQWNDLRFLLAVGRSGSISAAATSLGVNKATVSRRVAALEDELGTSLLTRSTTGYELTGAGHAALAAAEQVDEVIGQLQHRVGKADHVLAGTVRVTAPPWFVRKVIVPELEAFLVKHPQLQVLNVATDEVLDLTKRAADVGVRNCVPQQNSLLVRRVGEMGFSLYAARSYLDRQGVPRNVDEVRGHALIAFHDTVTYIEDFEWLNELDCPIAFRATDTAAQVDAAIAGLGLAVLPAFLANVSPDLVRLHEVQPPALEAVYTVMPPEMKQVARVRAVADWIAGLFQRYASAFRGPGL